MFMKSVIISFLLLPLCVILSAAENEIVYQSGNFKDEIQNWRDYHKIIKKEVAEDGSININSGGHLGGISRCFNVKPERLYDVKASLTGTGKVQLAVNGSSGFAYSAPTELSQDRTTEISISYYEEKQSLSIYLFSAEKIPSVFSLKSFSISAEPELSLAAEKVDFYSIEAEDFPGSNGKIVACEGSSGKAVSGGKWYRLMEIPAPQTALPFYVYLKVSSNSSAASKDFIKLYRDAQVLAQVPIDIKNEWQWIKAGPLKAAAAGLKLNVTATCEKGYEISIDKAVISTNADISENELNKGK
ncbi:MAG: hypothetical protein A2017_13955 [Lentisphaerae bacterium GWF2_44_16]|nr:MAG: hypothetical protein A2017_13955 [Lentisphaerae bacterium GWF2_44_16]